jgi:hypothetical protein
VIGLIGFEALIALGIWFPAARLPLCEWMRRSDETPHPFKKTKADNILEVAQSHVAPT